MFLARFKPLAFTASRYYTSGVVVTEPLLARLKNDRKTFMKEKKQPNLNVVKGLLSDFTYYTKSANFTEGTPEEEALMSVLQKAIKRRQDSVNQYEAGGRPELAQQEKQELDLLQAYLPEQMSPELIKEELIALIGEVGATSAKDMGKVMKAWKYDAATADRKTVSNIVKELLK
ncbi:Yqey-like protein-domain-containing protein [Mucor mucedo]|uniref:Yqey-like protein-domain-containing protein n=1 Tax=Mucor mucedo TaxID=29922 RepID=UPI00221F78EF|nr:Yqey-like protein-domain-containing protein [Mucor mucedo]KAI7896129.1 Yqey-like protein-domain-containing protein [Mucor mucedo]